MPEHEIPCDLIAETAILSGMVQSEEVYFKAIEHLKPEYFYRTENRKVFEVIRDKKAYKDFYVLETALKDYPELTIDDFMGFDYSVRGDREIESITEKYRRREGSALAMNARSALLSDDEQKACDTMSALISQLSMLISGSEVRTKRIADLLPEVFGDIERISKGGKGVFLKTGINGIDNAVSIAKTDMVIIGARPSNCKSTLAGLIGRNICREGGSVLNFFLDTARKKEALRALCSEAGVNIHRLNSGKLFKRDLPKLSFAAGPLSEMNFFLDDTRKLTVSKATAIAKRVICEHGPLSAVFFDFVQNVKPDYKVRDLRERMSIISEALHEMPHEVGCPVFPLSQLARYPDEEKYAPQLHHLKETGDFEEDSDIVLMLYYPEKYSFHKENPEKKNLLEVHVRKFKDGPTCYIPLNIFHEEAKITDRIEKVNEDGYNPKDWQQRKDIEG